MIEIRDLSKTYRGGNQALININFTLETGMFGLLGPNGAGKTTFIRILVGILSASSGHVSIFGHSLHDEAGRLATKAMLGYLPQHLGVYPNLSAREFLNFVAALKGVPPEQQQQEIDRVLEIVRLAHLASASLKSYSGGMQRRIGIAQALLGNPKLLIVDEPTSGLDPEERLRIRNTLATIARDSTVILSTHLIEDINQSCRSVGVIASGHRLFEGDPRDLADYASGHVWLVVSQDKPPDERAMIISMLQLRDGMQYRILTELPPAGAVPVQPTLEDGYLWLMQQSRQAVV